VTLQSEVVEAQLSHGVLGRGSSVSSIARAVASTHPGDRRGRERDPNHSVPRPHLGARSPGADPARAAWVPDRGRVMRTAWRVSAGPVRSAHGVAIRRHTKHASHLATLRRWLSTGGCEMDGQDEPRWTFLTNHAHVLVCIAENPDLRGREIAELVGVSERRVQGIIRDLVDAGYVSRRATGDATTTRSTPMAAAPPARGRPHGR
jgi:hypothetical protein